MMKADDRSKPLLSLCKIGLIEPGSEKGAKTQGRKGVD